MRTASSKITLLVGFVLLSACGEEPASVPELRLDPATLEVSTDGDEIAEVTEFRRAQHAYAGAVDEELFIAVALDDGIATGDPQDVLVYLCDDEDIWLYLGGKIDADGEVMFDVSAGNVRGADDVTIGDDININLAVTADEASGDLTIAGQGPQSFVALPPDEGTNVGFFMARTAVTGSANGPGQALAAPSHSLSAHPQAQAQVIRVGGWIVLNPTYRVRGAVVDGAAVDPVEPHLAATTVSVN